MTKQKDLLQARQSCGWNQSVEDERLLAALNWAIGGKIFDHLARHGNTNWLTRNLVLLAIVWAWSGHTRLTGAFDEAQAWSQRVLGSTAVSSYQGLMKALVTWTGTLLPLIWNRLHELMEKHGGQHWRVGMWLPLAVDGSRTSVPRTKDNERAFCAPNYGKSRMVKYRRKQKNLARVKTQAAKVRPIKPQIWLTLLWHMSLHLPWSWKSGPSYASEREHLRQILRHQQFPENTLFCGDAGFTGYDLWKELLDHGHSFLIRIGANVRLLRKLGYVREGDGIVYFWPDHVAAKAAPPIVLRLFCFQGQRSPIYVVTNVLSARRLSDRQAQRLYQMRWGVELQFRHVKQTFGRRKLRSKRPDRVLVELDWSLLSLWLIQLFAIKEQILVGQVPEQCSTSQAIEAIRMTLFHNSDRSDSLDALRLRLRCAVKDEYRRTSSKECRFHPNYKSRPKAGKPKVLTATHKHHSLLAHYLAAA